MNILILEYEFAGNYPFLLEYYKNKNANIYYLYHHNLFSYKNDKNIIKYQYNSNEKSDVYSKYLLHDNELKAHNLHIIQILEDIKSQDIKIDLIFANINYINLEMIKKIFPKEVIIGICEYYFKNELIDNNLKIINYGICSNSYIYHGYPEYVRLKIDIIDYNTDCKKITPSEFIQNLIINDHLYDDDSKLIISFLRHNYYYCNLNNILKSADKILDNDADIKFLLIDHVDNKKQFSKYLNDNVREEYRDRINVVNNISYLSWIKIIQRAFVFLNLDFSIKLPHFIFDVMSTGCICVLANNSINNLIIQNKFNGILVDQFEPDNISANILDLFEDLELSNNIANHSFLGTNNKNNFDYAAVQFEELNNKYISLISRFGIIN